MMQGTNYHQQLERWIRAGQARMGLAEIEVLERCGELPLEKGWHRLPLPEGTAIAPHRLGRPGAGRRRCLSGRPL